MLEVKSSLIYIIDNQLEVLRQCRFDLTSRNLISSEEALLLFNDELDLENLKLEVLKMNY